jgi:hypothetical protein
MAENLAYLPGIDPPTIESYIELHYYVYGYYFDIPSEAKTTDSYLTYGVLYIWPAQ